MTQALSTLTNHQIRLAARPVGMPKASDWSHTSEPVAEPAEGGVTLKTLALSLDPAMRGWMNEGKSYIPPVGIGEVMRAGGVGVVVASKSDKFAVGDYVSAGFGVQEYITIAKDEMKRNGLVKIDLRAGSENAPPIINPDGSGGPVPLSSSLNVLSAINTGLNAQLRLMEQNGSASILAQPVLSTRNGAEASFLAGGEFPYSVSNINGTTIQFKPYGIRLEITPRVDDNGVIRARIMSEVSDLDLSVMGDAGPALRTRKTETEFNVMQGGTIVLSGLLTRDVNAAIDKVPFLGDIPVLGALFRSRRFQNNETELVVFVTPHAVDKHTLEQAETLLRARQRMADVPRATEPDLAAMPGLPAPVEDRVVPAGALQRDGDHPGPNN